MADAAPQAKGNRLKWGPPTRRANRTRYRAAAVRTPHRPNRPMSPLWTVLGAAVVAGVLGDILWSTLTFPGAGPLGRWVLDPLGRRLSSKKAPRWVGENVTVLLLVAGILSWTAVTWFGWTLVFCGADDAVLTSPGREPAGVADRIYFAGFSMTTLGTGDYLAGGAGWRLAGVLASLNGFVAVSLLVAYLMAVVAAVHERRAIGAGVGHLGPAPVELVAAGAKDDFAFLSDRLAALTARLELLVQQTDAFPILGHDREGDPTESFTLGVAALGETAVLLGRGVSEADRPPAVVTDPLRQAVLRTVRRLGRAGDDTNRDGGGTDGRRADAPDPPPPDLADLARQLEPHGMTVAPDAAAVYAEDDDVREFRRTLHAWVRRSDRTWDDLCERGR